MRSPVLAREILPVSPTAALITLAGSAVALVRVPSGLPPAGLLPWALVSTSGALSLARRLRPVPRLASLPGAPLHLSGRPLGLLAGAIDVLPAALAAEPELFLRGPVVQRFVSGLPGGVTGVPPSRRSALRTVLASASLVPELLVSPTPSSLRPVASPPGLPILTAGLRRVPILSELAAAVGRTASLAAVVEPAAAADAGLVAVPLASAPAVAAAGALPVEPFRPVLLLGLPVLVDRPLARSAPVVVGVGLAGPTPFVAAEPAALVGGLAVAAPPAPVFAAGPGVAVTIPRRRRAGPVVLAGPASAAALPSTPGAAVLAAPWPAVTVVFPAVDAPVAAVDPRPVVVDGRVVVRPGVGPTLVVAGASRVAPVALVGPLVARASAAAVAELAVVASSLAALCLLPSVVGRSI